MDQRTPVTAKTFPSGIVKPVWRVPSGSVRTVDGCDVAEHGARRSSSAKPDGGIAKLCEPGVV
jgi:hypothetical protein